MSQDCIPSAVNCKEERIRRYRFKNTLTFDSIEDLQEFWRGRSYDGGAWPRESDDTRICSGVIDGNCLVLQRTIPLFGTSYMAYFVGAPGYFEVIKAAHVHEDSLEDLIAWLESDDFWARKEEILAENDLPLHEYPEEVVREVHPRIYAFHQEFMAAYAEYLDALAIQPTPGPRP